MEDQETAAVVPKVEEEIETGGSVESKSGKVEDNQCNELVKSKLKPAAPEHTPTPVSSIAHFSAHVSTSINKLDFDEVDNKRRTPTQEKLLRKLSSINNPHKKECILCDAVDEMRAGKVMNISANGLSSSSEFTFFIIYTGLTPLQSLQTTKQLSRRLRKNKVQHMVS